MKRFKSLFLISFSLILIIILFGLLSLNYNDNLNFFNIIFIQNNASFVVFFVFLSVSLIINIIYLFFECLSSKFRVLKIVFSSIIGISMFINCIILFLTGPIINDIDINNLSIILSMISLLDTIIIGFELFRLVNYEKK